MAFASAVTAVQAKDSVPNYLSYQRVERARSDSLVTLRRLLPVFLYNEASVMAKKMHCGWPVLEVVSGRNKQGFGSEVSGLRGALIVDVRVV